jgi:hypothetical protein
MEGKDVTAGKNEYVTYLEDGYQPKLLAPPCTNCTNIFMTISPTDTFSIR